MGRNKIKSRKAEQAGRTSDFYKQRNYKSRGEKYLPYIAIAIIMFLLGYVLGYSAGIFAALDWAAEKSLNYFRLQNISIEINRAELASKLWQYRNNI